MMMMRASASSFPAVKMSCTLVAHLTLEQFTHVSSTKHTKVDVLAKEFVLKMCARGRFVWREAGARTPFVAADAKCSGLTWA